MDIKKNVRCPCCKRYFEILIINREIFVIGEPPKTQKTGFLQGAKSHHPHRHAEDRFQMGKDILRANAAKHLEDQEKYPPNMPVDRRRDEVDE